MRLAGRKQRRQRGSLTGMPLLAQARRVAPTLLFLLPLAPARAAEHITLSTGYELTCDHRVADGAKTRLYTDSNSFIEIQSASIASIEVLPDPPATPAALPLAQPGEVLTPAELHEVLGGAGQAHDLDVDLLAAVVHAESAGRVHARSRTGAQGLMQLMPATAASLGIHDAWAPKENVGGGAAYLDSLLTRYGNDIALALAAYNAGPGAVDRYHGIPPYRETRRYVAHIIHEFNRRYTARQAAASLALRTAAGQP